MNSLVLLPLQERLCLAPQLSVYLTPTHETRSPRPSPSIMQVIKDLRWEQPGTRLI